MNETLLPLQKPELTEKKVIEFLIKQGITVKTNTKARGNLGVCFKNRIDVSRKADKDRRLGILIHEYAHKIHYEIEKDALKKGGSLETLFKVENSKILLDELISVTNFIDENSEFKKFYERKIEVQQQLKTLEGIIRKDYPDFKRSFAFKPANDYFRKTKSPAKYLLKYDRVKIVQPITRKENIYSVDSLDRDFPEIPSALKVYIRFKSLEREYKRLYRRKNKAEKYYKKPTELFARFVEGIFLNAEEVKGLAPFCYCRFKELLLCGYYGKLRELFELALLEI
jgi:hypothetical protein